MATSQNTCFNHLHFRDCETETWRHSVTRSTFHSKRVAELGFDSECDPKASSLNHGDALIFFFFSVFNLCMHAVNSVTSDSSQPQGLQPARLLRPWGFSRQEYWSGLSCPPPGDLPHPGTEPRYPALQVDSLPSDPPEKPKNTGVGSLSLFQGNFLTQESNRGLLHCRQILYQLRYRGSLPRVE